MPYTRHTELANRHDSALLVIDVQERLVPHISDHERLVANIERLVAAAELLNVPAVATEQYPQGLGGTVDPLRSQLETRHTKVTFSAATLEEMTDAWKEAGRYKIIVAGMESHVCVMQTVLDLLAEGFRVSVVADAVSSRSLDDKEVALRRMETSGACLVTTEMIIFEWLETASADEFKAVQQLIK